MLLLLWPIVMAAAGSVLGFFVGRLAPADIDRRLWNPGIGALFGAAVFAIAGVAIGIRKVARLRGRLAEIHSRREELRREMERRLAHANSRRSDND